MEWDLDWTDIVVAAIAVAGSITNAFFTWFRTRDQDKRQQQQRGKDIQADTIRNYLTYANQFLETLTGDSYVAFSNSATEIMLCLPDRYKEKTQALTERIKFIKDHPRSYEDGAFSRLRYEVDGAKYDLEELTALLSPLYKAQRSIKKTQ